MESNTNKNNTDTRKNILKRMIQVFALLIFTSAILFLSAGNFKWIWGWIYIIIYLSYIIINASILPKELIAERGKSKDNVKKWDQTLNKVNIIPGLGLIVIGGLDQRFKWTSDLSIYVHLLGLVMYISGSILFSWSMMSNHFFSTLVRIQIDRDHKVATNGPYKLIRHPGYSGFILSTIGVPLIIGSLWAFIPAFFTGILFVIRTILEDRTLYLELEGYKEFSEKTRYRLIPGIW
jgi:protein-S-isoprenylcysteine O-methyltransferase Ste14